MRLLLVLLILGVVVWQFPQALNIAADITGIGSGDACGAVKNYFQHLGDDEISKASQYKIAGDRFPGWVDDLEAVDSVTCTCTEDLSDRHIQEINRIPDSVTNVTDTRLVTFTLDGTYDGETVEMEGGALVFQLLTPGWFVTQEGYTALNGESRGNMNIAQFSSECSL